MKWENKYMSRLVSNEKLLNIKCETFQLKFQKILINRLEQKLICLSQNFEHWKSKIFGKIKRNKR